MKTGNQHRVDNDQALLAGIKKHLGSGKGGALVIDGEKLSAGDIIKLLQHRIDLVDHASTARSAWQQTVHEVRANAEETDRTVSLVRQAILVMYASKQPILADFGLSPRRARRALSLAEKQDAAAKIKATRAARHTLGKRQKAAITGDDAPPAAPPPANANGSPTPTPPHAAAGGS